MIWSTSAQAVHEYLGIAEMYPRNERQCYEAKETKELACYAERLSAIFRKSSMITNISLHCNCKQGLVEFESSGVLCQSIPVLSACAESNKYVTQS